MNGFRVFEWIHSRFILSRRVRVLARILQEWIPPESRVLDVGCGDGKIAEMIGRQRKDIKVLGLDVLLRKNAEIPVVLFEGQRIPYEDASFDVVVLMDVLHHSEDPVRLLEECRRVCRSRIIIKDHLKEGFLAQEKLAFMDRVSNERFEVRTPQQYWKKNEWLAVFTKLKLPIIKWDENLPIHGWPINLIFGQRLHFMCALDSKNPDRKTRL